MPLENGGTTSQELGAGNWVEGVAVISVVSQPQSPAKC